MREKQQKFSNAFYAFIQDAINKNIIFIICTACLAFSTVLWSLVKENSRINDTQNKMHPSSSY